MTSRKQLAIGGAGMLTAAVLAALFAPLGQSGPVDIGSDEAFALGREIFAERFRNAESDSARLATIGLQARKLSEVPGTTLLTEPVNACAGRGVYWLRDNGGVPLVFSAPHRGSDRHTGTIAATLFSETDALAAGWNSAPRRADDDCANGLDLARASHHLFSAFSLAFADVHRGGRIVQLHGFDGDRRATLEAQDAAIIISNGTREPGDQLLDVADCLSVSLAPHKVLVYPVETRELGALTNAQGQLLREIDFDGFIHLEISLPLREALVADEDLRSRLGQCLARGLA